MHDQLRSLLSIDLPRNQQNHSVLVAVWWIKDVEAAQVTKVERAV